MNTGGLDRTDKLPLYLQIKNEILARIRSAEYPPGSLLKTEMELCATYDVSRVTVRKALKELVEDGWLERRSGSGTFIRERSDRTARKNNLLGLVVTRIQVEFVGSIIAGFEEQALGEGRLTVLCASGDDPEVELRSIDELVASGVRCIAAVPCDESRLSEREQVLQEAGVSLVLIDREPELSIGYDYIGSDNYGGAYSAVRHLYNQGFRTVTFVAYKSNMSSIRQRIEGYLQAAKDFSIEAFEYSNGEELRGYYEYRHRIFIENLRDHIQELKAHIPFGIVAVNDFIALECIRLLKEEGIKVGEEAGVVGFDNTPEGAFASPPLTTVVQNAKLIGMDAAKHLIARLSGRSPQFSRIILPTQIMLRKSCGE